MKLSVVVIMKRRFPVCVRWVWNRRYAGTGRMANFRWIRKRSRVLSIARMVFPFGITMYVFNCVQACARVAAGMRLRRQVMPAIGSIVHVPQHQGQRNREYSGQYVTGAK